MFWKERRYSSSSRPKAWEDAPDRRSSKTHVLCCLDGILAMIYVVCTYICVLRAFLRRIFGVEGFCNSRSEPSAWRNIAESQLASPPQTLFISIQGHFTANYRNGTSISRWMQSGCGTPMLDCHILFLVLLSSSKLSARARPSCLKPSAFCRYLQIRLTDGRI